MELEPSTAPDAHPQRQSSADHTREASDPRCLVARVGNVVVPVARDEVDGESEKENPFVVRWEALQAALNADSRVQHVTILASRTSGFNARGLVLHMPRDSDSDYVLQ